MTADRESSSVAAASADDFAIAAARTGLPIDERQMGEFERVYPLLLKLLEAVRRPRDYAAEPAHIFKPIED
jgi:hypothetical protein